MGKIAYKNQEKKIAHNHASLGLFLGHNIICNEYYTQKTTGNLFPDLYHLTISAKHFSNASLRKNLNNLKKFLLNREKIFPNFKGGAEFFLCQ